MTKLLSVFVIVLCVVGVCTSFFFGYQNSDFAVYRIENMPIGEYLEELNAIGDSSHDYVNYLRDTIGELSAVYSHYHLFEFDESDETFQQTLKDLGLVSDTVSPSDDYSGGTNHPEDYDPTNHLNEMLIDIVYVVYRFWGFFAQLVVLIAQFMRIVVTFIIMVVRSLGFVVDTVTALYNILFKILFGVSFI